MSTTSTVATDHASSPPGHPVRNVCVILALVVVLLVVAWVGGLVTPRISSTGGTGSYNYVSGAGTLQPDVRNDAMAAFEIHGAEIIADGVTTLDASLDATPLDEHPTVQPGEIRPLLVRFEVADCGATPPTEWQLELTTRTALGLTRTITFPSGPNGPGPDRLCL